MIKFKTLAVTFIFCLVYSSIVAQSSFDIAQKYLQTKYPSLQNSADLGWVVTDEVLSKHNQVTHLYLRQTYQNLEISNVNMNLAIKNGQVVNETGKILTSAQVNISKSARMNAENAIRAAAQHLNLKVTEPLVQSLEKSKVKDSKSITYTRGGISLEPIPTKQVWVLTQKNQLKLAWDLSIYETNQANWWSMRIDAATGEVLEQNNWIVKCQFDTPEHHHNTDCQTNLVTTQTTFENPLKTQSGGQYRVFPYPLESPSHGTRDLVSNPADILASPFGWHDTNGQTGAEFTITRGNNVYAYEDRDNNDSPGASPDGGSNLIFDNSLNLNGARNDYLNAATTNLFYWNNLNHDIFYRYGFDELSGNFQVNNYNRGGSANDAVRAESQDGSGFNNANFGTPPDGQAPTMQMFLWGSASNLTINSPSNLVGTYPTGTANFGANIANVTLSGELQLVNDNSANPTLACQALPSGSLIGKIAVIDRGTCTFVVKVKNAQDAGAIAVLIINNVVGPPPGMSGTDASITIPILSIDIDLGQNIKNALNAGTQVQATFGQNLDIAGSFKDSSFDNGIITHEYGHGISNRLTGGPANSNCLFNEEQMGEGWSDYFSLMLTMKAGDLATTARGIGTFSINQPTTGGGIRPAPYTTNLSINNFTYANVGNANISVPHGVGFIWCSMLWDMTWKFIDRYGYDPDIYKGSGGNNKALQLVIDGLKLQPCNPGFIDGRDAILLADKLNNNGANQDIIWEAFARRGLGYGANQGASTSRTDGVVNFDLPPAILLNTTLSNVLAQAGQEITFNLKIKNNNDKNVQNIIVKNPLPNGLTYVNASADNNGNLVGNEIVFPAINLDSQAEKTYTFKAKVNRNLFPNTLLADEFESNTNAFTASTNGTNLWQINNQKANSGQNAWFVKNIDQISEQILTLNQTIAVKSNTFLSFYHYFDTELGFDGGVMEVSENNGSTWTDLGNRIVANGYNTTMNAQTGNILAGKQAFSGRINGFQRVAVNLSSFNGKNIRVRFRFLTDFDTEGDGWYIDDIHLFEGSEVVINNQACLTANGVTGNICNQKTMAVTAPDCRANAGFITPPSNQNPPIIICRLISLNNFSQTYDNLTKINPGANFESTFVLTKAEAPYEIIASNSTGKFNFETMPSANYWVWGLSYSKNNTPNNISTYLNGKTNLQTILNEIDNGSICANADNRYANNNVANVLIDNCTPLENPLEAGIKIFPNPSNGILNIKNENLAIQSQKISLVNLQGKVVWQAEKDTNAGLDEKIDLNGFAKGMYFLKIEQSGRSYIWKIISQ
jgi:extracellular elastinolytic metalloproteinase